MNICSDNHDEICYEGRDCPLCIKKTELEEAEDTITELKQRITELEDQAK